MKKFIVLMALVVAIILTMMGIVMHQANERSQANLDRIDRIISEAER